jgi:SAM-dependent methyltransferase
MLLRVIVFFLERFPVVRRWIWRSWYGRLARRFPQQEWTFMNYGYAPDPAEPAAPPLDPADEPDRLCIQLYAQVVAPVDLAGKTVLEVGSGRGGGASYLARYHRPSRLTGVDFSPEAVAYCRRRHAGVSNLAFIVGDAERLPLPDLSFDVVVNVESSHCYGDVARFFREVVRVLRPGGHFLYADLRAAPEMAKLEANMAAVSGWDRVARVDITDRIVAALAADDDRKRRLIAEHAPEWIRHLFGEFAGLAGSRIHDGFRTRAILYHRFVFQRR